MLILHFEGWFQCRFATDPDPSDDPRGVSGPTLAVAGEPPLDRKLRTQGFVCPRWPRSAADGVYVRKVILDGVDQPGSHPLQGARFELIDAQYRQRNLIYVNQPFEAPIDPFAVVIEAQSGVRLERKALWDVVHPEYTIDDVFLNRALLEPRINRIAVQDPEVAEATGFLDYAAVRQGRRAALERMLETASDPTARAALRKRIISIDNDRFLVGEMLAAQQFMGMKASYSFALNSLAHVHDPQAALGGSIGTSQVWPISFWMGGYDVDTMCGYMRGSLQLPFGKSSS